MDAPKLPGDSVDIPLLGSAGGNLRFELMLAAGDDSLESKDDPFVPLNDGGRFSRVLLGRVASGSNHTLHPVAVKIQRGSYRPAAAGSAKETLTNPLLEEMWKREREHLLKCAGDEVIPLIDLGDHSFRNRPVTDCRDDALLRDHGLPEFSKSITRYLTCAACASKPGRKTFYTLASGADENLKGEADVRRRTELYRDFGAVVNTLSDRERAEAAAAFPCAACPHREECYPAE